jgi:Uma2 family endonuclease
VTIALRRPKRLTVSEFIEMIRPYPDEERWELFDGEAVLMSSQTERHQRIVMNLLDAGG